ncbi:MAG TPA: transglycosylase SLT domain-containing protein [Burkholderiales bacterium]|nr:transglycosylase SLT domain-containing protein [Burkholderiales bacterium]
MKLRILLAGIAAALVQGCATAPSTQTTQPEPVSPPAASEAASTPPAAPTPAVTPPEAQPAPAQPFDGTRSNVGPRPRIALVDRTTPPPDLWQRIRQGFSMPDLDNALVREKTNYYATRPEYLQRIFDRSKIYLFHIVDELEKRGMPTELALLPMVESAFNPMAYSRAHASGLWQFIPGTGKRFELQQNWWYDGRRDIVDSTTAALDYLQKLYEMHGDWHLALASYNWGENAVARAIAKNRAAGKATDYAHLTMPLETRHYIPKLQALKNIINNPEPLGIVLDPIPNQPYFTTYTKLRDIDVQLAAKLAEMTVDQFMALNPGFSRPLIRASVTPRIVLPADKVDVFHENLQKLDEKSLVSWRTYSPTKGDSLESIAKKYGMTVSHLKEVNGIPARSRTLPTVMVVPATRQGAVSMTRLPIMYAPPIPITYRRIFHTVKPGETLASIARRYGVSLEDVKRLNPKGAAVGQKVTMEVRSSAKSKPKGKPRPQPKGKPRS